MLCTRMAPDIDPWDVSRPAGELIREMAGKWLVVFVWFCVFASCTAGDRLVQARSRASDAMHLFV